MTQIFAASTLYGAMTVAAAIDAGQFGGDEHERILLVCNNVDIPEVSTPLHLMPGAESIRQRFTKVAYWNSLISPYHPAMWAPRDEDLSLWRRMLGGRLGVAPGPLQLIVESIQVKPAQTLCKIFQDASVTVYADGVMSYGPTRNDLHRDIHSRISEVLYLDLVPGLEPMLLTEYQVPSRPVDSSAVWSLMAEVTQECVPQIEQAIPEHLRERGPETAVLLGQYLSSLGILTEEEEENLHLRMFESAVGLGFRTVIFKPHPSAPDSLAATLAQAAREAGVEFLVLDVPVLAETVFHYLQPRLVIGCFSTGLFTAKAFYGISVAQVGAREIIRRMRPYENSNRIPVTITHALLSDLESPGGYAEDRIMDLGHVRSELSPYVATVGFCMQPKRYAFLRGVAEDYVAGAVPQWDSRPELGMHFNPRVREKLSLPGPPLPAAKKERGGKRKPEPAAPVWDVSVSGFSSLLESGDDDGALEVGEKLLTEQESVDVLVGMAQIYVRRRQLADAESCLVDAMAAAEGNERALVWIRIAETAELMGRKGKDLRRSAARQALKFNPNSAAAARLSRSNPRRRRRG
ncbi:polysialyltransferase family glycosyltransferase [Streptomyces nitrosporeus]|uniref:polysialyltransferase family glycosyltransferase n=1 Tax=Streptomyces nitrosporeus TaxID=28894 RepID=UPI00167C8A98|nr:polysialyltransferase family glycosyltransferase [Streptomyces nitrosporeus]GGZ11294.1 hypothetical protein GCM10010327_47550 [Streptomyces nitrosporeus]